MYPWEWWRQDGLLPQIEDRRDIRARLLVNGEDPGEGAVHGGRV
jgi:hypothetical protein